MKFETPTFASSSVTNSNTATVAISRADSEIEEDAVKIIPSENDGTMQYQSGLDGAKFFSHNPDIAQIMLADVFGYGMSLMSDAPRATEIPLTVYFPTEGEYELSGKSMAIDEDEIEIWITDHATGRSECLNDGNMKIGANETGMVAGRYTLRIGSSMVEDVNSEHNYYVWGRNGLMHVSGLEDGDVVEIYTMDGRMIRRLQATGSTLTEQLSPATFYIVRINSFTTKCKL